MAKVSYANLKLRVDNSVSTFEFLDNTVEVLNYLPVEDKYDLIMITLQKAEEDGIYNEVLLDVYFHLNLIYMYSNLSFTERQREDELKLYDTLKCNGFIDLFLSSMNSAEYDELYTYLITMMSRKLNYKNTAGAVLQSIIQDLPRNAQAAAEIVNNFDASKYQAVIDFATAANGGRNINTNQ